MRRRSIAGAAGAVAAAALAAVATAVPAGPGPVRAPAAADRALARRALVRQADVGRAWRKAPVEASVLARWRCKGHDPGLPGVVLTGEASSPQFIRPRQTGADIVLSTASVYRTEAMAARAFAVAARGFDRCARLALGRSDVPAGLGGVVTVAAVHPLSWPSLAGDRRGVQIAYAVDTGGEVTILTADLLLLRSGRATAVVAFLGFGRPLARRTAVAVGRKVSERLDG